MSDPSYRDVADWLPTDVRERIEATTRCPLGERHDWQHDRIEFQEFGRAEPIRVIDQWRCGCGLVHTTDPEGQK